MTPLVVVGAAGHGREVLDIVEAVNLAVPTWDLLGVVDDDPARAPALQDRGVTYLGPVSVLAGVRASYVLGVGSGATRAALDARCSAWGRDAATLVHPAATVGRGNTLDPGVVFAAGARVTTNVVLGRHTHVNVNATVSHDSTLGRFVTVSPGATIAGACDIGDGVLIGAGATVIQGRTVGAAAVVGAGAVVVDNVAPASTVIGVPARPLVRP